MIGVLEHLSDPNFAIKCFKKSKSKFLYISVPLFSFSTFLEHANPLIYPRQLGAAIRICIQKILNFSSKKFNLSLVGECVFGTDIADLHRVLLNFSKKFDIF